MTSSRRSRHAGLRPDNFNSFSLSHDGAKIATTTMTMAKTEVWALDVMSLLAQKP